MDLNTLPLPWRVIKNASNEIYMLLDANDFYKVIIPTGFYVSNNNKIAFHSDIEFTSYVELKKGKIPISLLYNFINLSAKVYNDYRSEFAASIFYNNNENKYELLIPKQTINGSSITYDPTNGYDIDLSNLTQIIDMHSHHIMPIGFSITDNHSDEILGALGSISLIIKRINDINFLDLNDNIDIRFTIQGKYYELDVYDIFESNDDSKLDNLITRQNHTANLDNYSVTNEEEDNDNLSNRRTTFLAKKNNERMMTNV